MRQLLFIIQALIFLIPAHLVPCLAFSASNSFAPPSGKTLLFVGQDRDTIARYVRATRNTPGGTMLYTSIQEVKGLKGPKEYGSGPQDGKAILHSYPNSVIQIGLYMVGGLENTITGTYDAHLKTLSQWIKKANRPVYLRIGYEFDSPQNHYDPQQYKQAFRYVVDFLRKEGVRNTAYVWHSYCWVEKSGQQWMDWYPGDDYVDWFGASMFSTPSQLWTATDFLKLARKHNKPFMICESTPWGMYTIRGKIDFLNHLFQFIKDNNVEAFCYIDSNWDVMPMYRGQHIGDARLEENVDTKNFWLKEIDQDRYLKASPDLFRSLGWVKSKQ
jgi:Glycosyl hydrolase family 26